MIKRRSLWALVVVVTCSVVGSAAWGQDDSAQQSADGPQSSPQQPVPAYGPTTAPIMSENPPISGLDLPNLEPHGAPLSYLQPGAHVSESIDSNIQNELGGSSTQSLTRAEGSLELHRLWSNYDLALDYLGGVGYYNVKGIGLRQVEELGFEQKVTWKRGELAVRDAFSYQPEGTFGGSYGSVGTTGAGLEGASTFFGGTELGSLGQVPRVMNLSLVDVVENLTPKSAITVTGGYGFVHYLQNLNDNLAVATSPIVTGSSFIGSSQVSGQLGYSRVLGPRDQAALVYGYQGFLFSTGVTFHSHVIQAMWGHRISGRMDFLAGVGPQFTQFNHVPTPITNPTKYDTIPPCVFASTSQYPFAEICPENSFSISAAGRLALRYKFPKTSLSLFYDHYLTSGSGFFAGAKSDIVRFSADRPLNRVWSLVTDIGYARNDRAISLSLSQLSTCAALAQKDGGNASSLCPGVTANTYQYGFAGFGVHRMFGRNFHGYASYQFNELVFDGTYCRSGGSCSLTSQRQVGTVGLDWLPRPTRLD
jgi:hypothetical protein